MYITMYVSMVRKQVYIEERQDEALKRRAHELGVTESQLIRDGIDIVTSPGRLPEDEAEWQAELVFMRERAGLDVAPGKRSWAREELYEQRPKHLSR